MPPILTSLSFKFITTKTIPITLRMASTARKFAPLNPDLRVIESGSGSAPQLKGVVFDVDGTLW